MESVNLCSRPIKELHFIVKAAAGLKQMGKLPPDQLKSYLKVGATVKHLKEKNCYTSYTRMNILKDQTTQPHQTLKHQLDLTWYTHPMLKLESRELNGFGAIWKNVGLFKNKTAWAKSEGKRTSEK